MNSIHFGEDFFELRDNCKGNNTTPFGPRVMTVIIDVIVISKIKKGRIEQSYHNTMFCDNLFIFLCGK